MKTGLGPNCNTSQDNNKIRGPASALLDKLLCPPGPGGHNNLSNSVLEGLLYFISPLN